MPTIIDRYMLRQFLQVLVICFLSLAGLYIVIDAFGHLDHFVDYADAHGNLLSTMGEFYAYRSLAFFDWMSGILALVAAMFTVTWIQRHHEMTALMAAGIPRLRVLRPVLVRRDLVSFAGRGQPRAGDPQDAATTGHRFQESRRAAGSRDAVALRQPDRHPARRRDDRVCRPENHSPQFRAAGRAGPIRPAAHRRRSPLPARDTTDCRAAICSAASRRPRCCSAQPSLELERQAGRHHAATTPSGSSRTRCSS